jgi:hypothetical protein
MSNIFFETQCNGLKIVAKEGYANPEYENGVLTVCGMYVSYDQFQTIDLYLDEKMIQVGVAESRAGDFRYRNHYYVFDYGVYNWRTYRDVSVHKALEKIQPIILPKKERHRIELNFGRSKKGKEDLEKMMEAIDETYETVSYEEPVRIRQWDQTKELLVSCKKTKCTLYMSTIMINEIADFVEKNGYQKEANDVKKQRAKAMFEPIGTTIDFSKRYKKAIK